VNSEHTRLHMSMVMALLAIALVLAIPCVPVRADENTIVSLFVPTVPATMPAVPVVVPEMPRDGRVTNVWIDTDIRQAVQDISFQTDTVILCDPTVQGIVSMSIKDMPLTECLERICASGGYSYTKIKDYYIVGKADPGSPLFQCLADPVRVKLSCVSADQVRSMLHPSMATYLTFDKADGAIVVTAPESIRNRILEAIKIVDQPGSQVAIEGIVFELTEEGSKQLGLDWQFDKRHISAGGKALVGTFTYDSDSDVGTIVDVTLRAIVESRKGQVLANPRILVMNNTQAEIFVGQEKYITLLSGQASNPYYTLQTIKSGVTLKVLPYVGADGRITMELEPEVSDVVADGNRSQVVDVKGNTTAPLPVVTRRHAKTSVSIKDGQTVVIGGLLMAQNRATVDKVPLAGDLPVLGAAFRNVQTNKQQQEVIILITAHVVDGPRMIGDDLAARLEQHYVSPLDGIAAPTPGVPR